jgi:hypothetical protein
MSISGKGPLRGFRAVAEALRLEDYPLDKEGIDYAVGDIEVENGANSWVPVRDLTDRVRREGFNSPEEIIRALHEALESRRKPHAA